VARFALTLWKITTPEIDFLWKTSLFTIVIHNL